MPKKKSSKVKGPAKKKRKAEHAALPPFDPADAGLHEQTSKATQAWHKHEEELLENPGVRMVTTDYDRTGKEVILVIVRDQSVAKKLPKKLDGVKVLAEVGEIEAF